MKQRWQNRQPAGGSTALGISPSRQDPLLVERNAAPVQRSRAPGIWVDIVPVSSLYRAISMTLPKSTSP